MYILSTVFAEIMSLLPTFVRIESSCLPISPALLVVTMLSRV
jgi:hypothetical protein